jgi:TRAP transporter TAXI family solute receptor
MAALLLAAPARADMLSIATSAPGAVFHSAGTAIAQVVNDGGTPMTVQAFASPNVYLPAVNSGQIAFGVSNAGDVQLASVGAQHFEGRRLPELRAVAVLFPLRQAIYVRNDSDFRTLSDLRGRRMPTGYAGQKTIVPLFNSVLATEGLTVADLDEVRVPNVTAGATAFIEGAADAFFFAAGGAKVREADASVPGGIRAINMRNTPESLAALQSHWPAGYMDQIQPGPASPGVMEPIFTITHDAMLLTGASTPDEVVYAMVQAIHDNKEALTAAFGSFALMDPAAMWRDTPDVQWHPGALAFYRDAGIEAQPPHGSEAGAVDGAD